MFCENAELWKKTEEEEDEEEDEEKEEKEALFFNGWRLFFDGVYATLVAVDGDGGDSASASACNWG